MKTKQTEAYPHLKQLGIAIHPEPYPYVKSEDLDAALKKAGLSVEKFNELFGAQTCIVIDGVGQPYPWDCELVLKQMLEGYKPSIEEWD